MQTTGTRIAVALALAAVALPALAVAARPSASVAPRQAHMVFFTLKDHSKEAREAFVASCQKYLTGHEGMVSVSFGTIAEDVVEPVSVRDFDIALHVVFEDKAAGQAYLKDPRHTAFVEENKDKWSKVLVFDSYLAAEPAK